MIETVVVPDTGERIPRSKLLNPLWWAQTGGANSTFTAPETNNGTPYLSEVKFQLLRNLLWFTRNPFGNFNSFVIGIQGRGYTVTGSAPVLANGGGDIVPPQFGWRWAILRHAFIVLPFVSYLGASVEFYFGWRPLSGAFGIKLRKSNF